MTEIEKIDFSKLPRRMLTPEEQEIFERRAHTVDDNENPPTVSNRPERKEEDQ